MIWNCIIFVCITDHYSFFYLLFVISKLNKFLAKKNCNPLKTSLVCHIFIFIVLYKRVHNDLLRFGWKITWRGLIEIFYQKILYEDDVDGVLVLFHPLPLWCWCRVSSKKQQITARKPTPFYRHNNKYLRLIYNSLYVNYNP